MDETQVQRKMEVLFFGLGQKGRDLGQNHRRPQGRSQHTMERVIGSVKYVRSLSRAVRSGCRGQKLALGARTLAHGVLAIRPTLSLAISGMEATAKAIAKFEVRIVLSRSSRCGD